ncbi:MAG: archease, partial [Candidatus Altiarchaeota archaeon]|nr:archease [Candidatus Altiarchaeota archaeon]
MPFEYLDHEADIGILASGKSLEEAFEEGAKAMFNVMADVKKVQAKKRIGVSREATDIASLFIEWLNELIAQADLHNLVFSKFKINSIEKVNGNFGLEGEAWGESIDPKKHDIKTEVKAATYSGLKFEEKKG